MQSKINWGILSTGAIAKTFARNLRSSETGVLRAVASRDLAKAQSFAAEFSAERAHGSYQQLLDDPEVHAVYIAPPHPQHVEWAIKAAEAGKHLLVEKPIAVNHAQAMAIVEAARANDVLLMEAFMYRCHPQTARLVELIREKVIGEVQHIAATFSFRSEFNRDSRLFSNDLAGGGILDVGCYPVSISRLIAGAASGTDFLDPIDVKGVAHLGETGVDEWAIASATFPNAIIAQWTTGVALRGDNVVRITGTDGHITLPNPWVMNRYDAERGTILVHREGSPVHEIVVDCDRTSFTLEADVAGRAILSGAKQAASPAMSIADSLGNVRTLDRWRESIGLTYELEKPARSTVNTFAGLGLRLRVPVAMKYGSIAHVPRPISKLVMGVDNQTTFPHVEAMFDDYFERGGNTFDTAHIYGHQKSRLLGAWIKAREIRDQINVIVKGAHTPSCNPEALSRQLRESLDLLQIESADLYFMHRDNLEVPASAFVDVLNEHVNAGRIRAFGVSNWSRERVDEANDYARSSGLRGFDAISNNFSLARMVEPPWTGCVSSSDVESIAWFNRTQMPLLSWSSQARGFFVPGRAAPDRRDDEEIVRCWYADDNFERLKRATELARQKNVDPINIAAAYVLHQPFPTFALIGPRTIGETQSSFGALDVELTSDEVKWLNLEA